MNLPAQGKHKAVKENNMRLGSLKLAYRLFDLDGCGTLREIKEKTRKKFREMVFEVHPDVAPVIKWGEYCGKKKKTIMVRCPNSIWYRSIHFHQIKQLHDKIQSLKYVPMTHENCNEVLELQKGFKTTKDIDLGLNG